MSLDSTNSPHFTATVLPELPPPMSDRPTMLVRMVRIDNRKGAPPGPSHPVFGFSPRNTPPVPFCPAKTAQDHAAEPSLPTLAANMETYVARNYHACVAMTHARELLTTLGFVDKPYPTSHHAQDLKRHAFPVMHVGLPTELDRPAHFITIKYLPQEGAFEFSDMIGKRTPEAPHQVSSGDDLRRLIQASVTHYEVYTLIRRKC